MSHIKQNHSPTMNEVAKLAEVSVATVSRVINGNSGVSAKLEKRVLDAMKELRYHPSSLARSFKMQQTQLIGVIIPLLDHPFYSRLATAIEQELFRHGYRAIICNSEEKVGRERAYFEMLMRQRIDGMIINTAASDTAYIDELEEAQIPYVLIDRNLNDAHCSKVFCDNSNGGLIGMRYLIELGHRRIGVVAGPTFTEPIIRRLEGVRLALDEAGIPEDLDLMFLADTQLFDMGYEAGTHLLNQENPPTAIFALTDVTAVGVIHAAAKLGYAVPNDLSVLGYDDIPIASYIMPPLSTVAQPIVDMGQAAVQLLLQNLATPELEPEKIVLPPKLVIRQSTLPYTT